MNNNPVTNGTNDYSFLSGLSLPEGMTAPRNKIGENPYAALIETVQQHYNLFVEYENKLDEEKKQSKTIKSQFEKFLLELFEVADFLEGVLENVENVKIERDKEMMRLIENFQHGLKLLHKKFAALEVEPHIPETGAPFTPGKNYCIGTQKSETLPEETIGKVVKKGYTWKGRLLRPAYVMVIKN